MSSFDSKKFMPHLIIIAGFAVVALLFCYPQLQGKVLFQHDTTSWQAMSKESRDWYEKTGENVLWSNSMFGGNPTYTYYLPESNNYIYKIQSLVEGIFGLPTTFFFLAMLFFYLLLRVFNVNRWLAAAGAVAYAFATYNPVIISAGHNTKMFAIAYMPGVLAGLILLYRSKWLAGVPLLLLSLALMVISAHYQIIYYAMIVVIIAVIGLFVNAIKEGKLKEFFISSAVALVVAAVALGPSMATFLPTQEYAKESIRGGGSELTINHDKDKKDGGLDKDYAFSWSNSIGETFCILVPFLYGGSSNEPAESAPEVSEMVGAQADMGLPMYWGPQIFLSGPVYFGAVICFLFVLGLLVVKSNHKWWMLALCILGIMMSWGKYFPAFNYFLFDNLPGYNKFRTPSMTLVIPQLIFPLLGIWGLQKILFEENNKEEILKKLKIAAGITGGLSLLLALGGSMFFDYTSANDARYPAQFISALKNDRADMAMASGLKSAFYIVVAAGLIWAFIKDKIKLNWVLIGMGLVIVIDLLPVAARYLNEDKYRDDTDYEAHFAPSPVDQQIMQDKDPYYRVFDLSTDTYNDAMPSYFHKSVGGYNPAKMEIYQDLIDVQLSKYTNKFNTQVLNMLNTKYIIVPDGQQGGKALMPNPDALGNAWFVNDVKWAKTADEEMLALNAPFLGDTAQMANAFNPAQTAVMRNSFENELKGYNFGKDSAATVKLTKYGLNDLAFESKNSQNGLAVFSDIYYPHGWKAYVDGKETPIMKANYVLRAIKIPAGQHKIEFKFDPPSFHTGNTIALITSLLIFITCIACAVVYFRQEGKEKAA